MKLTFPRLTLFGFAFALSSAGSAALAQFSGQPQTGSTQGFGTSTQTGTPSPTSPGAIGGTPATNKYGFGAPGSGATGVALVDYSTTNAVKGFSTSTSSTGATNQSAPNAFGASAFSNSATTGVGGAQGLGGGGLGGGGLGGGGLGGLGNFGPGARIGGLGGVGGLGGLGGGFGQSNANQNKKKIRIVITPDIELDRSNINTTSSSASIAQARLGRIPLPAKLKDVNASIEGDLVVLNGKVASEADKRLVERLVKLEPGVNSVRNELVVQPKSLEKIQATPNR